MLQIELIKISKFEFFFGKDLLQNKDGFQLCQTHGPIKFAHIRRNNDWEKLAKRTDHPASCPETDQQNGRVLNELLSASPGAGSFVQNP